jgi:hypothetical protein
VQWEEWEIYRKKSFFSPCALPFPRSLKKKKSGFDYQMLALAKKGLA